MNRVNYDIVFRHAQDVAFFWSLRNQELRQQNLSRSKVSTLENRLDANIDGLRLAGEHGWRVAKRLFQLYQEPGEAFTLAVLAMDAPTKRASAIHAMVSCHPQYVEAIDEAIGWHPFSNEQVRLQRRLQSEARPPSEAAR